VPELPEVETIRRGLAPHVEGRVLDHLEILDWRWCRPLAPDDVSPAVEGRRVDALTRRGKYLVFELSGDVFLICHLRMTGAMLLEPAAHTRVRFRFGDRDLHYDDPRRFGTGELALGTAARDAFFASRLGPEPWDATPAHLRALARGSRAPVKAFLLDQRRIAGVGNIYADEALFRANVHPLREAGRLTRAQWEAVHAGVLEALELGIAAKGASIDDFRDPDGVQGTFQDRFLIHLRAGEPCHTCGTAVVKLRAAGRGTYVCPRCQPAPRRRLPSRAGR
jgi:formamidopyrimidine-DNA glycosylase